MADDFTVDHTSTEQHFMRVLSLGNNLDLENYKGRKSLKKLYEETQERDVVIIYNRITGKIERHAQNVAVLMENPELQIRWLEIGRKFPKGKPLIHPRLFRIGRPSGIKAVIKPPDDFQIGLPPDWSTRETRKRGQSSLKAAFDGVTQELSRFWEDIGRAPKITDLVPLIQNEWGGGNEIERTYRSSAYPMPTHSITQYFQLSASWIPYRRLLKARDYDGKEPTPEDDNWVENHLWGFRY